MIRASRTNLAVAVLVLASRASAEDTSDIQSILDEHVVTTASTTAESESAAPAVTMTITADQLRRHGVRNIAEAVNFLGLGVVAGDPLRTPDVGARGVLFTDDDGKHFLLLVNGHAINDPLYGAARFDEGAGIPFELVDHIEVVLGPGSVLYGSNAMMGVINVITKDASSYRGGHAAGEFEPGRSLRTAAGAGVPFKLFGAQSEITAGIEYYRRFGPDITFEQQTYDIRNPRFQYTFGPGLPQNVWGGTVDHSYYADAPTGMVRFKSGDFEVNLLASAYKRGIPYATETLPVAFDDDRTSELDRSVRLDVKHNATLSQLVQLTSRAYADGHDFQRRANLPGPFCLLPVDYCQIYDAGRSRWIGIEERVSLNWLGNRSLVTMIGVDVRQRWVSAKQDVLDADTGQYLGPTQGHLDDSSLLVAPYIQQTYSPAEWIDLNAGARLDADSRFDPVISPRGAVAFHPFKRTTVKAIYSQAFRAPTWAETSLANRVVAPSDGVKPETVRSVEGAIEQRFGTQRILFGMFGTHWDGLIEPSELTVEQRRALEAAGRLPIVVGSNLIQYQNTEQLNNYGWNGAFDGSVAEGKVRYGVNATVAVTHLESRPGGLAASPRAFGNARVSYDPGGYLPSPALAVSVIGRRPADRFYPYTTDPLPSVPAVADFRLTLTGAIPGVPGLSYRVSGDVITASRSPYYAGPVVLQSALGSGAVTTPQAVPIDQYRVFFGLRYDFATGAESSSESL